MLVDSGVRCYQLTVTGGGKYMFYVSAYGFNSQYNPPFKLFVIFNADIIPRRLTAECSVIKTAIEKGL